MLKKSKIKSKIFGTLLTLAVIGGFITPLHSVQAAGSLYISPSSGNYSAGQTFSASVLLSTTQAANAVSGVVSFDASKLEVTSLNRSGSKVSVWVRDPSFSNSSGTISFEGIIPNPGYTGTGGKILGISFKAKGQGSASVKFNNGKVLANDGNGTNITGGLNGATYNVGQTSETPPPASAGLPALPKIQSETHPDSNAWYSNNQPQFKWSIPVGTTAVSTSVTDSPSSDPGNGTGLQSSVTLKDQKNGVFYLHVKFRNRQGWGPIAHYKFQIDTEAPSNIDLQKQDSGYLITATDVYSGIDHFEWKQEGDEYHKLERIDGYYDFVGLSAGDHQITLRAVDKAGNKTEKVVSIISDGKAEEPITPSEAGFALNWVWLAWALGLLVLILLLIWLTSWYRHRTKFHPALVSRKDADKHDNADFLAIADEMMEQISILEHVKAKRKLTPEETKLLKRIHASLQNVEKLIEPES